MNIDDLSEDELIDQMGDWLDEMTAELEALTVRVQGIADELERRGPPPPPKTRPAPKARLHVVADSERRAA